MKLLLAFTILLLGGCSQTPTIVERVEYNPEEFKQYTVTGTATIKGRAFVMSSDGVLHTPMDKAYVRLNPITTYSQQWYDVAVVNRFVSYELQPADPRYLDKLIDVVPDKDGYFIFNNVPEGKYYIMSPIYWGMRILQGEVKELRQYGGFVVSIVIVKDGQVITKDVTTPQIYPMGY